ncbi:MAG: tRNA pseudouridine(13) synthase TruD, partial [Thermoplasmata archaeon]
NVFAKGEMGEIERKVIESEGLEAKDFIIKEIPRLSTKGNRREILAPLQNFECRVYDDMVSFKFSLLKGEYATSLLREYMKVGVMNY